MLKDSQQELKQLGSLIGNTRRYLGMSQLEAANGIGIGRPSVSQTETGERQMGILEIRKWAELFGVPINYFISDPPGIESRSESNQFTQDLPDVEVEKIVNYAHYLRMNSTHPGVFKRTAIEDERKRIVDEIGPVRAFQLELQGLDDESKKELADFASYRRAKIDVQTQS